MLTFTWKVKNHCLFLSLFYVKVTKTESQPLILPSLHTLLAFLILLCSVAPLLPEWKENKIFFSCFSYTGWLGLRSHSSEYPTALGSWSWDSFCGILCFNLEAFSRVCSIHSLFGMNQSHPHNPPLIFGAEYFHMITWRQNSWRAALQPDLPGMPTSCNIYKEAITGIIPARREKLHLFFSRFKGKMKEKSRLYMEVKNRDQWLMDWFLSTGSGFPCLNMEVHCGK